MELSIRYKKKNRRISKAIHERVQKKTAFIAKHLEEDHPVHLILEAAKTEELAEMNFHFRGHDIIAKASAETLYHAIDEVIENCTRQLEKILAKSKHHKGEPSIRTLETEGA
jgi:ribosomal subunit interface protein